MARSIHKLLLSMFFFFGTPIKAQDALEKTLLEKYQQTQKLLTNPIEILYAFLVMAPILYISFYLLLWLLSFIKKASFVSGQWHFQDIFLVMAWYLLLFSLISFLANTIFTKKYPLFEISLSQKELQKLHAKKIPQSVRQKFSQKGNVLSKKIEILKENSNRWLIKDKKNGQTYFCLKQNTILKITPRINYLWILITNFVQQVLFCGLLLLFLYKRGNTSAQLGLRQVSWKTPIVIPFSYLVFLPIYFAAFWLSLLAFAMLGVVPEAQKIAQEIMASKGIIFGLGVFMAIILAPVCEEFQFRVFIYTGLRNHFGPIIAMVLSSIIFSLVHFNYLALLPIFVLGMFLAFLYEKTQNLWVPILAHMCHNTLTLANLLYFQ